MKASRETVSHQQLSVPNDLGQDASVEITGELKALLADVFTLVYEDQELSLAHDGAALRLSPAAGRASGTDIRYDRRYRRARAQTGRGNFALDPRHRAAPAPERQ